MTVTGLISLANSVKTVLLPGYLGCIILETHCSISSCETSHAVAAWIDRNPAVACTELPIYKMTKGGEDADACTCTGLDSIVDTETPRVKRSSQTQRQIHLRKGKNKRR